jgi:hypothetical protein
MNVYHTHPTTMHSPANRQDLTRPYVTYAEHGKPASPPGTSDKPAVRKAHEEAGIGWGKKRTPVWNGYGVQYSSTRKRADFPLVSRHEKTYRTSRGGKANERQNISVCALSLHGLEWDRLVPGHETSAEAASAYREGSNVVINRIPKGVLVEA